MAILEFIIALLFICLLVSLFVSWIMSGVSSCLNSKGKFLKYMLEKLEEHDNGDPLIAKLYDHPAIRQLSVSEKRLTSRIPASIFARAISDLVIELGRERKVVLNQATGERETVENPSQGVTQDVKNGLDNMDEGSMKQTIKMLYEQVDGDGDKFKEELESWYDQYMVRVNHTYSRKLQPRLFLVGLLVAVTFNIDMLRLSSDLWTNRSYQEVARAAEEFVTEHQNVDSLKVDASFFEAYRKDLELNVGWGWQNALLEGVEHGCEAPDDTANNCIAEVQGTDKKDETDRKLDCDCPDHYANNCCKMKRAWIDFRSKLGSSRLWIKLLGFVLTAFIASFGAPFWYDALKKLINIKGEVQPQTGKKGS